MAIHQPQSTPDPAAVLSKALARAAALLGLSGRAVGEVVGISEASFSRLKSGQLALSPDSKEGQLALIFLRVFRSLDALVGGEAAAARAWLQSGNDHLGGAPASLIKTPQGLVHVADYLDAMRGTL